MYKILVTAKYSDSISTTVVEFGSRAEALLAISKIQSHDRYKSTGIYYCVVPLYAEGV